MFARTSWRAGGAVAVVIALALSACADERPQRTPVATPSVASGEVWQVATVPLPPDAELLGQSADAIEFRLRENGDRLLDAYEPGELLEHATLTQGAIDRGIFGLDALFVVGDELFEYEFRPEDGLGNGLGGRVEIAAGSRPAPNMRRVHEDEFGGPDSFSCATCHFKGGPDGAGTSTQNAYLRGDGHSTLTADVRNPPHVLGLGPVQALAEEMTAELVGLRDGAIADAASNGQPAVVELETKGISFGTLTANPDGSVDASGVEGVDADLIVRPFGWKGHQATIRGMADESFRIHMGVVSMHQQQLVRDGIAEDPSILGSGEWFDIDADGVSLEVEDGMLTTIEAYLSQLPVPRIIPPRDDSTLAYFLDGQQLFEDVGCASCHRPELELVDPEIEIRPQQTENAGVEPIVIDVARDGESPKPEPKDAEGNAFLVALFSDLRRHDMGPELATPTDQAGIPASVFVTRPLWGLAESAPFLHDGRAPTIRDAVRYHGGEAADSRDAYFALDAQGQAAIQVFLLSLSRDPLLFVP